MYCPFVTNNATERKENGGTGSQVNNVRNRHAGSLYFGRDEKQSDYHKVNLDCS